MKNLKWPAMLFDPIFAKFYWRRSLHGNSRHFTALQNISWHFMEFLGKAPFGSFHIFCFNFRGIHSASQHNFFMTQIFEFHFTSRHEFVNFSFHCTIFEFGDTSRNFTTYHGTVDMEKVPLVLFSSLFYNLLNFGKQNSLFQLF